jgi:predicted ATPase
MKSMNLKSLKIEGFKSIGEIELKSPNPFTVFVGSNAAGKSNIFEALEFFNYCNVMDDFEAVKYFGNIEDILNRNLPSERLISFNFDLGSVKPHFSLRSDFRNESSHFDGSSFEDFGKYYSESLFMNDLKDTVNKDEYLHLTNFCRVFPGKSSLLKKFTKDDSQLAIDGSNLEIVLKRVLKNEKNSNEIHEILDSLISGFVTLQIVSEELSGTDNLLFYERGLRKPLTKRLISNGTFNILSILTAIYQSEKPQFLCIEEPENGLNPKVVRELVSIIRNQCLEKGHYIWLNTHSQTLVSELRPEEIVLVDKVNGMTKTKQLAGFNLHGLKMDEALLTNSLGGGIPW